MSIQKILVPTDFSKNAANALKYAVKIAEKSKSEIILFHAYHIIFYAPDMPIDYVGQQIISVRESVENQINFLRDKIRKTSRVKIDCVIMEALPVDGILSVIKKKKIDLIIMGTKGASGIKKIIIGSVTSKIIEKSERPILVIPSKGIFEGIKKITYATDYHTNDISIIKKVIEIAKIFKSHINVLHVAVSEYTLQVENDILKRFIQKIENKVKYKNMSFQILFSKSEEKALEKYLKKDSTDVLVMSTRYHTLLEKFFAKNITKTLSYKTNVPMLVFHYKNTSFIFN